MSLLRVRGGVSGVEVRGEGLVRVVCYVPASFRERLRVVASRDRLSLGGLAVRALRQYVGRVGRGAIREGAPPSPGLAVRVVRFPHPWSRVLRRAARRVDLYERAMRGEVAWGEQGQRPQFRRGRRSPTRQVLPALPDGGLRLGSHPLFLDLVGVEE